MAHSGSVRRVIVSGIFDYAREVCVAPRPPPNGVVERLVRAAGNGGATVVTPLLREGGRPELLVVRGWWPTGVSPTPLAGEEMADNGRSRVAVTVTGVLRGGENVRVVAVCRFFTSPLC